MSSDREIQRIQDAYRDYAARDLASTRWGEANPGNRMIIAERRRVMTSLLAENGLLPLGTRKILEVGCGTGHILASLEELGAARENLVGIDLLPGRIEQALREHPGITFLPGNAERIDFPDGTFDLLLLFVVFSSILDRDMRRQVARECVRVLRPGGSILWHDFRYNNPQNPNVRGIRLEDVRALFPGLAVDVRRLTLVPQLARHLGPLTRALYPVLAGIPPLRTYYMALLTKP